MDSTFLRPARLGPPLARAGRGGVVRPRAVSLDPDVAFAQGVARWLDGAMLDPIVGLFLPGVGDLASSALGLVVVGLAIRRRLPAFVIARMLLNLALDAGLGSIPLAGDLFDMVHRAHVKNAELFVARHEARRSSWRDVATIAAAAVLFVGALALPVYIAIKILGAVF